MEVARARHAGIGSVKKIRKKAMSNKGRRRKKKCDMVEGGREAKREK